jgi:hypothetical protein
MRLRRALVHIVSQGLLPFLVQYSLSQNDSFCNELYCTKASRDHRFLEDRAEKKLLGVSTQLRCKDGSIVNAAY